MREMFRFIQAHCRARSSACCREFHAARTRIALAPRQAYPTTRELPFLFPIDMSLFLK